MEYLDFELEIRSGSGRDYPVAVLRSPAGEAHATMRFPFDQLALESHLKDLQIALLRSGGKRRRVLSPEERAVQDFGRTLFEALFGGVVGNCYAVSRERTAAAGQGLRVKLRIQEPTLAALPWEFLYDAQRGEYVCLSVHTPLVRYLELPQSTPALRVAPPLSILGVIANPSDLEALDVEREKERVERAVAPLRARGLLQLTWLAGQTWRDLQRAMRGGPWHVLHFVGHGGFDAHADEGLVVLVGEDGRRQYLHATQLGRLLADHSTLRLVLLNACEGARGGVHDEFSSTAAALVRRGIPAVLAMQYEITDRAAIEFARGFYEALADGLPVDAATTEARKAVSLEVAHTVEWGAPALYLRAADGLLFDLTAAPATVPPPVLSQIQAPTATRQATPVEAPAARVARLRFEPEMVGVPAGPFLMGTSAEQVKEMLRRFNWAKEHQEQGWFKQEQPAHEVTLPAFEIGRCPVTNAEYAVFVEATGRPAPPHWQAGRVPEALADHPVVNVTWRDAQAYVAWLGERTGAAYRLPTEAEWEKAARGQDGRLWPWGNDWDGQRPRANCQPSGPGATTPVGQYSPAGDSPYGAADMAGNVWEWCMTKWQENYAKPADDDPSGNALRVLRGGSWFGPNPGIVRCASRRWGTPGGRGDDGGFRVARSPR
jgi:formylglycine-generating enzyme required for sulfatase activity